jgi:hypothetical protein
LGCKKRNTTAFPAPTISWSPLRISTFTSTHIHYRSVETQRFGGTSGAAKCKGFNRFAMRACIQLPIAIKVNKRPQGIKAGRQICVE